jgi:hypothetical protein
MPELKNNIIFEVKNKKTGKIYVGKHSTDNPNDGYLGHNPILLRDIRKLGLENFEKTIKYNFQTKAEVDKQLENIVTEEFLKRNVYNIKLGNGKFQKN